MPIGNLFNRLLYAAKFADVNLVLSEQVNSASKIIYDRTPRERVQAVAPWLKVDGDAYPAVVDGRIVWIVDGYTTSNSYPNSKRVNLRDVTSDALTNTPGGAVVAQPPGRHQLHPQLREGRGRRLRRHGQDVRLGRSRSGAEDLGEGVPRRGGAQGLDPAGSA